MPRTWHINKWIEENGGRDVWIYDPKRHFIGCQICNVEFEFKRRIQHLKVSRHSKKINLREKRRSSSAPLNTGQSSFDMGLAKVLAICNIPVHKVEHPTFIQFMEDQTGMIVPSRGKITSLIEKESHAILRRIKEKVECKDYFILVDETKTMKGRSMAAILIGSLDGHDIERPYLINVIDTGEANSSTIEMAINESLQNVFGQDFCNSRFKLFVTNGANYCIDAALSFEVMFPQMIHITCISHGVDRISESEPEEFCKAKKVFLKYFPRIFSLICDINAAKRSNMSESRLKDLLIMQWNSNLT